MYIFTKPLKVEWKEAAPLPVGLTAHTAVLLHGSVYVGGGFEGKSKYDQKDCYKLDIYNVYANQWSTSPITTPHCWFAMTVLDDKLIIAGGETKSGTATNDVFGYDEGEWKNYGSMPTARCAAVAIGHQSMLIVVGGEALVKDERRVVATTELLDTTNGCWYSCDDLPLPYRQLKGAVTNNTLHLLGGDDKDYKASSQVFTASLDNLLSHQLKWQSLPDTPWCYSTPVVLYNKFLLTVGGRRPFDGHSQTTEVCTFDPSTGIWKQIANIPSARSFPAVVGVAGNKVIVIGGLNQQRQYSNNVYIGVFE